VQAFVKAFIEAFVAAFVEPAPFSTKPRQTPTGPALIALHLFHSLSTLQLLSSLYWLHYETLFLLAP
jgi:hypothetical protein